MPAGTPRRRAGDHHLDQRELAYQAPPRIHPPQNPAGSPGGSFGFGLHPRLGPSQNPAGSPGGSFGFGLHPRRNLTPKSRRLARRIIRFRTTSPAQPHPKIPPACPADHSASDYIPGATSPQNPAGSPGGSFGFGLHPRLGLSQNPAGLPGGSFGFGLHPRLNLSQNPAGLPGEKQAKGRQKDDPGGDRRD
jgi:hypothetical protein